MFDTSEERQKVERALAVRVIQKREETEEEGQALLEELELLLDTLDIPVVARELVSIQKPQAKLFVGTGKADELAEMVKENECDVIVFDNPLTPAQQRNWEKLTGVCVIDRHEVILDIFAEHARTKEARLQVGLARMEYSLPRLKRMWTHLSRQGGVGGGAGSAGGAARGEGETQLEIDRRIVNRKIDKIKAELEEVRRRRATQRKERVRLPVPHAAIVGYTNAGKSSLLNRITGSDALVENKLFATLDTTTRKLDLENGQTLLLTDTVGFVRNLPHGLVESFKATLEEAVLADYLIHVMDAGQPLLYEFHKTTVDVLEELGADTRNMITVLNKIDLVRDPGERKQLKKHFPDAVLVSAKTGEGLDELDHALARAMADKVRKVHLRVPQKRADLVALAHNEGRVLNTAYEGNDVLLTAILPKTHMAHFEQFVIREAKSSPADLETEVPEKTDVPASTQSGN
jgi:GTP-binding protein HflX